MKQIFDWLREQMRKHIYTDFTETDNIEFETAISLVYEAEAKWKAECCEWKREKILEFSLSDCVTSCGHAEHYSTGIDKYCRHCGKPIKISEVE